VAVTEEILRLARQLQGCETRLGLLSNVEGNELRDEMRRALTKLRDIAKRRFAQLEAPEGWYGATADDDTA
jgi:hypothetical protein